MCDGDSNDDGVCVCVCTLTHFTTCHYSQPLFRSPGGPLSGPHPQLRFLRSLCLYRLHPLGPGQLSQILRFLRQSVTVLVTLEHSCCPCTPLVHVVFRDNPVSLLSVSALLSLSVFVRFSLSLSLPAYHLLSEESYFWVFQPAEPHSWRIICQVRPLLDETEL